jgi:hypothetical protein
MMRKTLVFGLLAGLLAAPGVDGQTVAAGPPSTAANAVDPAAIQALKDMGAHLQSLKRFHVSTDLTGERVLADGQKLQHSASAEMDVLRPQMLRVRMTSARSERELIFDGQRITLFTPAEKYYSTIAFAGSLGELTDRLQERYGVELPLSDLFRWGTASAPTARIESAMNAGQDVVDHDVCDHYAFRQGGIDWQIWIAAGSRPLPRKIVITNREDEARPQSVSLIDWNVNPTLKDSTFRFTPPAGATSVEIVPLKTK